MLYQKYPYILCAFLFFASCHLSAGNRISYPHQTDTDTDTECNLYNRNHPANETCTDGDGAGAGAGAGAGHSHQAAISAFIMLMVVAGDPLQNRIVDNHVNPFTVPWNRRIIRAYFNNLLASILRQSGVQTVSQEEIGSPLRFLRDWYDEEPYRLDSSDPPPNFISQDVNCETTEDLDPTQFITDSSNTNNNVRISIRYNVSNDRGRHLELHQWLVFIDAQGQAHLLSGFGNHRRYSSLSLEVFNNTFIPNYIRPIIEGIRQIRSIHDNLSLYVESMNAGTLRTTHNLYNFNHNHNMMIELFPFLNRAGCTLARRHSM